MIRNQPVSTGSLFGIPFREWGIGLACAIAAIAMAWLVLSVLKTFEPTMFQKLRALATAISIPVVLLWFNNRDLLTGRWRNFSRLLILAIISAFGVGIALVIYQNFAEPAEWDFLVFWLDGHVGIQGVNFYEPANYRTVPLPIAHSSAFEAEVLEVGFRYPPLSMLLFLPLGYFDIWSAMTFWYVAHGLIMALSAVLLWKIFLARDGMAGLIFAVTLVAIVAGTISTFKFAQTNFLALLLLLFFWRDRDRTRGGMWLILAAYVKPFLLLLLLYPVLRKNVRSLLAALTTLIITSAMSIGIFGPETFVTFIANNPAGRMPNNLYIQVSNQSLLSTILRLTGFATADQSPLGHPLYVVFAVVLMGITCWLVLYLGDEDSEWGLALLLILALLIYPASYFLYSVLLIVPLLLLWMSREEIPSGAWGIGALIAVVLVLIAFAGLVFIAYLLLWSVISAIALWKAMGGVRVQREFDRDSQPSKAYLRSVEPSSQSIP